MRKYLLGALFALGSLFAFAHPAEADQQCSIYGTAAAAVMLNPGVAQIWCDGNAYLDVDIKTGTVTVTAGTGFPVVTAPGTSSTTAITIQGNASGVPVPVTGTFSATTVFPYTKAVASQTPSATVGSYLGVGGFDGTYFEPLSVTASGALNVAGTVTTTGTSTIGGSVGVISQDSSSYVNVHCQTGCATNPYSSATSQPTASASFVGVGGTDGTNFHPLSVTSGGALNVAGSFSSTVTFPYAVSYTSTPAPNSALAGASWDINTGYIAVNDSAGAGTSITAGTKGVPYFQGIGVNGAVAISAASPVPVAIATGVDANGAIGLSTTQGLGASTASPMYMRIQNGAGSSVANIFTPTGTNSATSAMLATASMTSGEEPVSGNMQPIGKDPANPGPLWVTQGGQYTHACPASNNCFVKSASSAVAGRLAKILITASGSGTFVCYDYTGNTGTPSGTIIGSVPTTPTVGAVYSLDMPAVGGIACIAGTGTAATVSYF